MNEERLYQIISDCDNLQADGIMVATGFGANSDLTLYIHKDCDFDVETDAYNVVFISTKKNDEFIDDTGDVHITDLFNELERIWYERDMETL